MDMIERILIEPKNQSEFVFISEMLKRMNIKNRILSIDEVETIELKEFNQNVSIETIEKDLTNENYCNDFINDIVSGLKKSSVYANKD